MLSAALAMVFLASAVYVAKETISYATGKNVRVGETLRCVVIDAGHGGDDPGKVGINEAKEKDVNLAIAGMVKKYLEANDVRVVMTRETDEGLYDSGASNKKVQDMKRRIALIAKTEPDIVVSIVVEGAGTGSQYAVPIAQKMLKCYFNE